MIVQRPRDRESRFKPFDLGVSAQWLQGRRGQSAARLGLTARELALMVRVEVIFSSIA